MGRPRIYDPACSVEGCEKPHSSIGYCGTHAERFKRNGTTDLNPKPTPAERFWSKVDRSGECWEWTAGLNQAGYGQFSMWPDRPERAHRFSWVLHNGPIPDDLCVLHACDNRKCVNPAHLFLGTRGDNIRDCFAKGRGNPVPGARSPKPRRRL